MYNNYTIKYSKRKSLSIEITKNCELLVRAPIGYPKYLVDNFIDKNEKWIEKSINKQQNRRFNNPLSEDEKENLKRLAKEKIPPRVEYFSNIMALYPTNIKITSAEKRFGSCSYKNALCFSYRLMLYTQKEIDYVIVHELAHIKYKNHGKEFYNLVSKYVSDYQKTQNVLRYT